MRYIHKDELLTRIRIGKPIQQWISASTVEDYVVLRWLWLAKERNGSFTVNYVECFDDGNEDYFDIYTFSTLDHDEFCITTEFDSAEEAMAFAIEKYNAVEAKFVADGTIQEEYKDYLKTRS